MKLNTAFKISALAAALSLTATVQAVTVNDIYIGQNDPSANQFVDLGSGSTVVPGTTTTTVTNKITSLHKAANGYFIQFGEGADAKYYEATVDDSDPAELKVNAVDYANLKTKADVEAAGANLDQPILGGLTQEQSSTSKTQDEIKIVDSNFLQYGTKEQTTTTTTSASGNLTDDVVGAPLQTGTVNANTPVTVNDPSSEHTITVGNLDAQLGQTATTTNYGVDIVKVDGGNLVGQTTLSLAGLTTTGDVTATNVVADTITLGGKDLAQTITDGDAATLAAANTYTDTTATTLRGEIADGDAATLATARTEIAAGDAATLANANTYTNTTATTLRGEIAAGDAATLTAANAYTDQAVQGFNSRVNQLNQRVNDVEKTAYRGIAIALAAQQQIPNIGAGQMAVFGGVGHYEGESAAALGLASVLADGRTSVSAALGFAGGSEIGGRVGVAYVFGGK